MITAIIKAQILPEKVEELRRIANILQNNLVRHEKGCEQYESFIDGYTFITIERWANQSALDEHLQQEHIKLYVPQMKTCIKNGIFDVQFIKGGEQSLLQI